MVLIAQVQEVPSDEKDTHYGILVDPSIQDLLETEKL